MEGDQRGSRGWEWPEERWEGRGVGMSLPEGLVGWELPPERWEWQGGHRRGSPWGWHRVGMAPRGAGGAAVSGRASGWPYLPCPGPAPPGRESPSRVSRPCRPCPAPSRSPAALGGHRGGSATFQGHPGGPSPAVSPWRWGHPALSPPTPGDRGFRVSPRPGWRCHRGWAAVSWQPGVAQGVAQGMAKAGAHPISMENVPCQLPGVSQAVPG